MAAGASWVKKIVGYPTALDEPRDIARFVILGGPLSCIVSPTVAHMAEVIGSTRATQQSDADKIAEMLAKLDQLSEDEVRALLDEKKGVLH